MTPRNKTCGDGYHINLGILSRCVCHCNCQKYLVSYGSMLYDVKEEKMTDIVPSPAFLNSIRNPAPSTYYLVLMPNGDFVLPDGGNYARSKPKNFYTLEDAKTKVLELMIEANKLGVPDYKPRIVTKTVQQRITETHTYDDDIQQWVDDNAKTLKGGD